MERYAILLAEETRIPVTPLSVALSRILDRSPGEVTRRLRESPWILAEDVPADALDPIFEALDEVRVKAVPEAHMPELPRALRVRAADVMPKGLFLTAAEPPSPPFVPWDSLWIVSAGNVTVAPEEAYHLHVSESFGGPTPGSAPLSASRKRAEDHLLVDLLFRGEPEWRFRIDGGDFSYDFLKEEMRPSSRENLRALLLLVRERAPHALYTERTLAFLASEPTVAYRFRSLAGFRNHSRWIRQAAQEAEESE